MAKIQKFNLLKDITKNKKITEWCTVDIHNNFTFQNKLYKISEEVYEYRVYNKAGEVEEFTNESKMDKILVVVDMNDSIGFYSEDIKPVSDSLVSVVK